MSRIAKPLKVLGHEHPSIRAAARAYDVDDHRLSMANLDGRAHAFLAQRMIAQYTNTSDPNKLVIARRIIIEMIERHLEFKMSKK